MARFLYNGGFIPSTLKQCRFRTPNPFYAMRDLRLLQPCFCCCCCCFWWWWCCCYRFVVVDNDDAVIVVADAAVVVFVESDLLGRDAEILVPNPPKERSASTSAVRETKFSTSFHFLHLISFKVGTGKVITVLN